MLCVNQASILSSLSHRQGFQSYSFQRGIAMARTKQTARKLTNQANTPSKKLIKKVRMILDVTSTAQKALSLR